jgi:hypothetical protein
VPRPAGPVGLCLSTATDQPYPAYASWLVLVGTGFAIALPALTAEITHAFPAEQVGVAGGLQSAMRELSTLQRGNASCTNHADA